jgi:hypothetical protein
VSRTYRRAVQEAVKQPVTGQFRASTQKYDLGSRTKTETERALCELKQSAHVLSEKTSALRRSGSMLNGGIYRMSFFE